MADTAKLGFTITPEGSGCASTRGPKHFLLDKDKTCVRIGRAPGNDIQVELRGCSQFHAEIRLLLPKDEDDPPRLAVRDLSMNGTGLKHGDKEAVQTKKEKDVPVYHEASILVPMQLKQNQTPQDRAWLKVDFDDPDLGAPREQDDAQADADAGGGPAPRKKSDKVSNGDKDDHEKEENEEKDKDDDDKDDDKEEDEDDGEEEDEDGEKTRTQFVDLLMKAKEISAGTSYEEAAALLSKKAAWKAVDEQTRKECFEIFVDHLSTHKGKKKKKKDKAGKKSKKRKHKGSEAEEEEDEDEAPRKKKKSKKGERRKKAQSNSS